MLSVLKKEVDVGRNKVSVTVLGPQLSLTCVTFGGLCVSSGSQLFSLIGN